jgi:hypothetical protein
MIAPAAASPVAMAVRIRVCFVNPVLERAGSGGG